MKFLQDSFITDSNFRIFLSFQVPMGNGWSFDQTLDTMMSAKPIEEAANSALGSNSLDKPVAPSIVAGGADGRENWQKIGSETPGVNLMVSAQNVKKARM